MEEKDMNNLWFCLHRWAVHTLEAARAIRKELPKEMLDKIVGENGITFAVIARRLSGISGEIGEWRDELDKDDKEGWEEAV